jgi:hypothetical protein
MNQVFGIGKILIFSSLTPEPKMAENSKSIKISVKYLERRTMNLEKAL